ncbi:MAG: alkaline phosphatase family protein [Erysipelotrichaceae bacterium]
MTKSKLMVFCLDALCSSDVEYMKTLPNFKILFEDGSYVKRLETVYPSLTYPCHVSILTGNYVDKHGIPHNEKVKAGQYSVPWYSMRSDIKCKTLMDYAKENDLYTCSLSWPVSGGANIDLNMPMIIPIGYTGNDPLQFLTDTSSKELIDRYYWKHGIHMKGTNRSLDLYTMALAPDIIRDYNQPDVMLVKMCDLDSVRHGYGLHNEHTLEQLRRHDEEFGILLESVRRYGDFENTNFVVLGDHGQSDVDHVFNFNIYLKQKGYIQTTEEGELIDYRVYCHSAGLCAWIELKDPSDVALREEIHQMLMELKEDPESMIGYVFTKEEAKEQYKLSGPFDFVIEGKDNISFGNTLKGNDLHVPTIVGDYKFSKASHGHLPHKEEQTTFIAFGPSIKKGVVVEVAQMVDEAPTMARMLGFEMEDVDGRVLEEILI